MRQESACLNTSAQPSNHICSVICAIALLILAGAGLAQSQRGIWQDEATLLANFGQPLSHYFGILPFYDQAAPPLALVALDWLYNISEGEIPTMRRLLLGLNLAIFSSLALIAHRKTDRAVLLTIAIIAVTPLAVRYCVEIKQYGFETQASLLFLVALRWYPNRPLSVIALAALLSFFSYSIMLVVGVSVLDAIIFKFRNALAKRWLMTLVGYTLFWLICYALIFQPNTALQTANYPDAYERPPLHAYIENPKLISRFAFIILGQPYLVLISGIIALFMLNFRRWNCAFTSRACTPRMVTSDLWQPLRILVALLVLIILLWIAKLYPLASDRQFMFMMPISGLFIANFLLASSRAHRNTAIYGAIALTLMPSIAVVFIKELTRRSDFQDTPGLYAFLQKDPSALVLPDRLFEPTLRYYASRDPAPPGRVRGWLLAETKPMETPQEVTAALTKDSRAIHQHVWQPILANNIFPEYADWLVRQARGEKRALIGIAQVDDANIAEYGYAAARQGCLFAPVYFSRGVAAIELDCSQTQSQH